jgi:hypothetical protein
MGRDVGVRVSNRRARDAPSGRSVVSWLSPERWGTVWRYGRASRVSLNESLSRFLPNGSRRRALPRKSSTSSSFPIRRFGCCWLQALFWEPTGAFRGESLQIAEHSRWLGAKTPPVYAAREPRKTQQEPPVCLRAVDEMSPKMEEAALARTGHSSPHTANSCCGSLRAGEPVNRLRHCQGGGWPSTRWPKA